MLEVGEEAEAKCVSVSPTRPELLAVGANDPFLRLFDRRMLRRRRLPPAPAGSVPSPSQFLLGTVPPPAAALEEDEEGTLPPSAYR